MSSINSICVFTGASRGRNPEYSRSIKRFGNILGNNGKTIVFGGGMTGLMYDAAAATYDSGGNVIAVIPEDVKKHAGLFDRPHFEIVVDHMHPRKLQMYKNADAFVAFPGADGTLDEMEEQVKWKQLRFHKKPLLYANIAGFWDPFVELRLHMRREGLLQYGHDVEPFLTDDVEKILPMLEGAIPPEYMTLGATNGFDHTAHAGNMAFA